jgi:broad specificity phosphatase PhoE
LRYATAVRRLLARSERTTLVVCHEIPVRYLANAAGGSDELNGPLRFVANATPYLFDEAALHRAAERIQDLAG